MPSQILGTKFHYDNSFISKPIKLKNLSLVQIGEICLEAGFDVPSHKQHCNEISYIFSGRGVFEIDGIKTEVTAGDIIITPKNGTHTIYAADNEEIYYSYTGFELETPDLIFPKEITELFSKSEHILFKDSVGIYDYFKKCMDEFYRSGEIDLMLIESYMIQIILLTARSGKNTLTNIDYRSISENSGKLVYLIRKYVERNIEKPITVNGIADSLGYSIYHISHLFKAKMNITLQDYISDKKTARAIELMKKGGFSLTEISDKLGFTSLQSFSRYFKNKVGVSPSQFVANLK